MFKNYRPGKYTSYMLFFLPLFFALFMYFSREADTWFLLSHGRIVLNYGIPHTEMLSMHTGFSFVMQQWLTATIFYILYKYVGELGFYIVYLILNALITYLIYKLCMVISDKKIYASTIVSVISVLILQLYYIEVRPQLFSYTFLLLLMIMLQKFYKDENSKMIYFLPLIPLAIVNFHAAFWVIFIILCLPYLAEYLLLKDKRFYKLLFLILIGCLISFINPYGIDAIKYGFSSYGVGNTAEHINEMMPFDLSNGLVLIMSLIYLVTFLIANTIMMVSNKKNKFNIHTILFIYGFFFMGLLGLKNMAFYYLFSFPFLSKFINIKDGKDEVVPVKTYILLGIILLCLFGYNIYDGAYKLKTGIDDVISYLDENTSKDIRLYTDYHNGSYVEFYGYKPYIDTRAEVYLKMNNKKEDILVEYFNILEGDIDLDKFLDKYNFDYLIVSKTDNLYNHLKKDTNYEVVFKSKDKKTFLFKRNIVK